MVAGIIAVHTKYGKLSRQQVMAPAITLAKKGFSIYPHLAMAIEKRHDILLRYPASRAAFLDANGKPLKLGTILKQPDLARTLETISTKGGRRSL